MSKLDDAIKEMQWWLRIKPDLPSVCVTAVEVMEETRELLKEQQEKIDGLLEDLATAIDDRESALLMLKEQQEQKEKWIRDIDLYIADAEEAVINPVRNGKGYAVGLSYGLNIAKEIIEGKRNHG